MEEKVEVRLTLKGKMAEKFKVLKDNLGIQNNTEVLRFLLKKEYDKITASKEGKKNV